MTEKLKAHVATIMQILHEVVWDRFTDGSSEHYGNDVLMFGWIERSDGKRDFVEFQCTEGKVLFFNTSSAKYSKVFSERLFGGNSSHIDCRRASDVFLGIVPNIVQSKDSE